MAYISIKPIKMDANFDENNSNSGGSNGRHWAFFGRKIPKSEFVFFCQVLLIYIVVITSIVNLTINGGEEGKLWTALLSSSIGYLLPSPSLDKTK